MHPPAAHAQFELYFVWIRAILTKILSVEHFCPLDVFFNRALKSVDLSNNKIDTGGISALCEALKSNSTLESLVIQNRNHGATKIDAAGAQAIAEMLVVNRALNTLNLSWNSLGDEGARHIATALPHAG